MFSLTASFLLLDLLEPEGFAASAPEELELLDDSTVELEESRLDAVLEASATRYELDEEDVRDDSFIADALDLEDEDPVAREEDDLLLEDLVPDDLPIVSSSSCDCREFDIDVAAT